MRFFAPGFEAEEGSRVEEGDGDFMEFVILRVGADGIGDGAEERGIGAHAFDFEVGEGGFFFPGAGKLVLVPVLGGEDFTGEVRIEAWMGGDNDDAVAEEGIGDAEDGCRGEGNGDEQSEVGDAGIHRDHRYLVSSF